MLSSFPHGSRALVTGASRGIGLEFVRQLLAASGFDRVYAACRQPALATQLAALASQQPRLRLVALDVADEAQVEAAAREVAADTDRLHLVVNAAGVLHEAATGMAPEKRLADVRTDTLAASLLSSNPATSSFPTRARTSPSAPCATSTGKPVGNGGKHAVSRLRTRR